MVKVSSSLTHPPQRRSFKFFAKLNGNHILITNFSKLFRKYQTFGLVELHNLSKGQLADRISKLWKSCVYDYQAAEHTTFEILTFLFFQLSNDFCQKFYENFFSKYILKVLIKSCHFTNIYDLKFLDNETTAVWHWFFF